VTAFVGGIIIIRAILPLDVASAEEVIIDDQIVASFEREFNHEPASAPAVTRSAIKDDVLYKTVNTIHWSQLAEQAERLADGETAEVDDPNHESDLELLTANSESTDRSGL